MSPDVADVKRNAPSIRVVQNITDAEEAIALRANPDEGGTADVTVTGARVKKSVAVDIGEMADFW